LVELFDAGVDSIYVILQLMYQLDLPVLEGFIEVHASNLEKLQRGENGQLLKRADGKLLKPADWQPPNLMAVLDAHLALRQRELKLHGAENWSAE
jgi:predicted HAD superfamily Cof-like phosphohydrolase